MSSFWITTVLNYFSEAIWNTDKFVGILDAFSHLKFGQISLDFKHSSQKISTRLDHFLIKEIFIFYVKLKMVQLSWNFFIFEI
jgi:hypothetical protein